MKIKKWIIHKLGGVVEEEFFTNVKYTISYPNIQTIQTCARTPKYGYLPDDIIKRNLAYQLCDEIKNLMKFEVSCEDQDDIVYRASLQVVDNNS